MIVPGSANPLLMAQSGDPLDELGVVERSLRFRPAATAYLQRTFGVAGNRQIYTWRGLVKRGAFGSIQILFIGSDNSDTTYDFMQFDANDRLSFGSFQGGVNWGSVTTTAVFRDPTAAYDVQFSVDRSANSVSIYVNGQLQAVTVGSAINANGNAINNGLQHRIGRDSRATNTTYYHDGYMSHVVFVDGQALLPSSFGQFHPRTGQWRPKSKAAIKAVVASGGANSFFLPFDDATNTTTLCADASSNGNNFTSTNISLTPGVTYDSLLDTPTNVFPTLNPVAYTQSSGSLSNGNLNYAKSGATGSCDPWDATMSVSSGKWYWEVDVTLAGGGNYSTIIGVRPSAKSSVGQEAESTLSGYGYATNGSKVNSVGVSAYASAITNASNVGVGLDLDAGTIEFFLNGASQGVAFTGVFGTFNPVVCFNSGGTAYSISGAINFGQRSFAYPMPAGFKALCTKNLPVKPAGPMKSTDAFVAKTSSGANIVADLTAASPWSDWIRIYKRRDAAEGWRWQFSDDPTSCLESNNTNAKIALPALGGASYLGYALKASAANGIATGRLVHVNGVADVVVDGLSNSRKMVMLRSEAGGNWFVYHPELTAGKLLYLNLQNAETTDASISAVTASGFTVAAALASGTYRWISFAEVEGFLKLWKYVANGSSDGPFHNDGLAPVATWWRDADTGTNNWHAHDTARDPYNQSNANLVINLSDVESSQHGIDMTSSGIKLRTSTSGSNLSGAKHVGISFGQPFRYANAR